MAAPARPQRSFRHTLILVVVALGAALAAVGGWRYARVSAPVNGPVIIISIDTLRADHLPAYGYKNVKTPNIDALAADGVVFERAYSHAPQTLPAHTSMLSGRLPFDTGVRDNLGFTVKPTERLLPQLLHERGYATGGVVSAYVLRKDTGIAKGFDFFDAEMPPTSPETVMAQVQRDGTESETVAEHWLDMQRSPRLFLFLHLYEPHKPYAPPARFSQYDPYDGEIAYSDEIVGRLMAYLKSHQLYDKSTIILVSDHGEGLGDHGEQEHGLFLYEEAVHVPLIIKQAGGTGAGRRVATPVQHVDLVPTVLALVKAPIPENLHGRSLKPVLEGTGTLPDASIYSEALYSRYHFGWSELTSLTDGRYKFIKAPREELYDLERDPKERTDVSTDRVQTTQAMRGALERLVGSAKIDAPATVSADARERLQALGYVGAQTDVASAAPGEGLPDPKDKRAILELYRKAIDQANDQQWAQAVATLQQLVAEDAGMSDVWSQLGGFAARIDRFDVAVDAYKHYITLRPADPNGYLGAAGSMLRLNKLDDAQAHGELAVKVSETADARVKASAHELLANIALVRKDADAARREAKAGADADPSMPLPAIVDARLLYDEGKFAEALPLFEQALAAVQSRGVQVADLHYFAGDTMARLERAADAEKQFSEELRYFPQHTRARAGLAMLYQATDRPTESAKAIADMLRLSPTPESYALAAKLWTMFGNPRQADAVRAEARRAFPEPTRSGGRGTKR